MNLMIGYELSYQPPKFIGLYIRCAKALSNCDLWLGDDAAQGVVFILFLPSEYCEESYEIVKERRIAKER